MAYPWSSVREEEREEIDLGVAVLLLPGLTAVRRVQHQAFLAGDPHFVATAKIR